MGAASVAGATTSTPSPHRRRPDRGSRLTPGPVTAGAQERRARARITNGLLLCCLRPVFPSITHRAAGSGRPQVSRLLVPGVGLSRLARCPLAPHPARARQVSSSRRLGYEHPERTFSKATPTRTRPGSHSFARALL